jgi:nitrogen-specific signal transduction histidine kinase
LRDLTEHRAADEQRQVLEGQLRQAQKMEAIGHLTGGIAHDFNNILTSVLGYVQLGAERVREWNDDKLTRYLSRAQRSGERARDLIQQMLTFSRGQQGEPRVLALDSVVDEGLHLLESTLPASIRIERHFARDLPPVMADPLHIEQILVNLCINARDAMASSGVLTVELARTQGRCHHCASCHQRCVDGEFVELVVGDTGPGIDVQLQNRIFEPFFSTKEVGKGSGMGLATVHGIVHEYGGHIVVDSEPGRGTRFRILLPIETAATTVPGARTSTNAPARSDELQGRVLLVDDNFSVGEFLEELLTGWGLEVSNFCDSDKARSLFLAAPQAFDLVILDQTMPQVTGMALAEEFMRVRPDLPVVLYTGYSEAVNEQTAKAAGIRALVRKPLDVAAFRKILSTILHSG